MAQPSEKWEAVIGLEVHAQLLTESKMFCACPTKFGADPNENTCPVCEGLPGSLPVLNRRAVEYAVRAALATNCKIAQRSIFARKNYFYPDLPKGYQISQYEQPLATEGRIELHLNGRALRVGLTRIHMEEDAGKSIHDDAVTGGGVSLVDLNRTGVPLLEIVSEPDLRSPVEASAYLKELRLILTYLGICDGNLEEGSLRCDANVSLRPTGSDRLGVKAEVKNMNSFRNVERALSYEIDRQKRLLEAGDRIVQETLLWDPAAGETRSMRTKEEAHDYRYFPEPDLVPLQIEAGWIDSVRKSLPELPAQKRKRLKEEYKIPEDDIIVLTQTQATSGFFERSVFEFGASARSASNWIVNELQREWNQANIDPSKSPVSEKDLAELLRLIEDGTISGKIAKQVLPEMFETGKSARAIVAEKGLLQVTDRSELVGIIDQVLSENPRNVEEYRQGKEKLLGFFVGQVMKKTQGKANPKLVNELLREKLPRPQGDPSK